MWYYFRQDRFFERATLTILLFSWSSKSVQLHILLFAKIDFSTRDHLHKPLFLSWWSNLIQCHILFVKIDLSAGGGTPQQTLAIFSAVEFNTMQHSLFFCQDSFSARSHLNKPLLFSRWWIWLNITFVLLSGSIFLCRKTLTNCDYFLVLNSMQQRVFALSRKTCPSEASITSPCYLLGGRILYNVPFFFLPRSIFPRWATLTSPYYFLGGRIWYNATLFVFVKIDCSAQGHLHKPSQFSRWSNLMQCDILLFVKIDVPRGVTLTNPCYFLGGRIWYNATFFILPISIFPRGPP